MNKLIAITVFSVLANLVGIANAQAAVVAEVKEVSNTIASVQLLSTGDLQLIPVKGQASTMQLTTQENAALLDLANKLADVTTVNVHRAAICMMIIANFAEQDLYVDGRLIATSRACFLPNETYPQTAANQKLADQLRNEILGYVLPKAQ